MLSLVSKLNGHKKTHVICGKCESNAFQDYFDDAKESRVKKIPKIQESSFKNQFSRIKIQESSFKIEDSRIKFQDSRFKNKRRLNQDKY